MNNRIPNPEQLRVGLTGAQADGLACVCCGADYLTVKVAHQPVGRSETGSQVFACVGPCVEQLRVVECREIAVQAMQEISDAMDAEWAKRIQPLAALADEYAALAERTGNGDLTALVFQLRTIIDTE